MAFVPLVQAGVTVAGDLLAVSTTGKAAADAHKEQLTSQDDVAEGNVASAVMAAFNSMGLAPYPDASVIATFVRNFMCAHTSPQSGGCGTSAQHTPQLNAWNCALSNPVVVSGWGTQIAQAMQAAGATQPMTISTVNPQTTALTPAGSILLPVPDLTIAGHTFTSNQVLIGGGILALLVFLMLRK